MTKKDRVTRDTIIQTLVDVLKPLDYVHAFWEGGAVAFNRIDEWSDIDLYVVVDDKKVDETFLAVEKALESLSHIKQKYTILQLPWPDLSQAFYKLEDASEYLVIDLVVLKLKAQEKFLEPEIHGKAIFYFNKSDMVKPPSLDRDAMIGKLQKRLERLKARFDMFNIFVQKEINRGNYLEAIDFYRGLTLSSLVEALRIKHNPVHHDFKMHYIHYELPSEVIKKLKHLCFIKDEKDLQEKYNEATKWFPKTMSEIDQKEIKRLIEVS
jgi:predicted nucleotidyltransferase